MEDRTPSFRFLRATNDGPLRDKAYTVYVEDSLQAPLDGRLRHSIRALLRRGERTLLLDLSRVSRIDAAGVGELVRAHNMAIATNGSVRVVCATGKVRAILERVGLLAHLEPGESTVLRPVDAYTCTIPPSINGSRPGDFRTSLPALKAPSPPHSWSTIRS